MSDAFLPPRLRGRQSRSSRWSLARPRVERPEEEGPGFLSTGIGPDLPLGLTTLFKEFGGGLTTLARMIAPGKADYEPGWADLGKGALSWIAGYGAPSNKIMEEVVQRIVPDAPGYKDAFAQVLGDEFRPMDPWENIQERGVIPTAVDVAGITSLAGAAPKAAVKGASAATRLAGASKTSAKLAQRAAMLEADPALRLMTHPYLETGAAARRAIIKPAQARRLAAYGIEDVPAAQATGSLPVPPAGMASVPRGTGLLGRAEDFLLAQETRSQLRRQTRQAEMERRLAARSPAVRESVNIARDHLMGAGVGRRQASLMVGDEVNARLSGIKALEAEFPDVPKSEWVRLGIRQAFIPDEVMTPEVSAVLDQATQAWATEKARVTDVLTQSRKGTKGLVQDPYEASLTKAQERMLTMARQKLAKAQDESFNRRIAREEASRRGFVTDQRDRLARITEEARKNTEARAGAIEAFDHSRTLVPRVWRSAQGLRQTAEEIVEATRANGGATYDPNQGRLLTPQAFGGQDTGYAVGLVPGTAQKVPLDQLTPEHIEDVVRAYQDVYQSPGSTVGTWVDDSGTVHIDPSEVVTDYDDAMIRAAARGQEAIFDFATGNEPSVPLKDRPDIAAHFLERNRSLKARSRELRAIVSRSKLDPGDADLMMAEQMRMAVRDWELGRIKHPDEFFTRRVRGYRFATKPSTSKGAAAHLQPLKQLFQNRKINMDLWRDVEANIKDLDKRMAWYYESHDGIERVFKDHPNITLGNGEVLPATEVAYQLLAVTSLSTQPWQNLAHAFNAMTKHEHLPQAFVTKVNRSMRKLADGKITLEQAIQELGGPAEIGDVYKFGHKFPLATTLAAQILTGNHMGKWTPEFLGELAVAWGMKEKKFNPEHALEYVRKNFPEFIDEYGPDQAVREFYGSAARTKLMSFADNLRDPANSMGVTLDLWMERLLSDEWGRPGAWITAAEEIRSLAREVSDLYGRKVMPHEIQAALWSYAMWNQTRLEVGHFRAWAHDAAELLREGPLTDANDPILRWIDEDRAPYEALQAGEASGKVSQRIRVRNSPEATEEIHAGIQSGGLAKKGELELRDNRLARWLVAREKINALRATDPEKALAEFDKFANSQARKLTAEGDGSFLDIIEDPRFHKPSLLAAAEDGGFPLGPLHQSFRDVLLGEFVPLDDGTKGIIRVFEDGNFATLVHENGHLLRRMLTPAQMEAVERLYGARKASGQGRLFDNWTVDMEERFANDFAAYHRGGRAPKGLESTFARVREVLRDVWEMVRGTFHRRRVHPELRAIFDEWLDPVERPLDTVASPDPWLDQTVVIEGRPWKLKWLKGGGRLFHGTNTPLEPGSVLEPGHGRNFRQSAAAAVSVTSDPTVARYWAKQSSAETPRVYEVEPIGQVQSHRVGPGTLYEGRVPQARVLRELGPDAIVSPDRAWLEQARTHPEWYRWSPESGEDPPWVRSEEVVEAPGPRTLAQQGAVPPKFPVPPATARDFYEAGRKGERQLARVEQLARRSKQLDAARASVEKTIAEVESVLSEGRLPSQVARGKLITDARKLVDRVNKQNETPSLSRTPARWQPLYTAVKKLGDEAKGNPELAQALQGLPETLHEVQRLALDKGFDPVHVRDFTPQQVRRLVFGNMRLGLGRDSVLTEVEAGTRKGRSGLVAKAGVDRSLESFLAASVEATNEVRTNAVIDWVENTVARQIPEGAEIPEGWALWGPARTYLLSGTEISEATGKAVQTAPGAGQTIVPRGVLRTLDRFTKDYDHWAPRAISKVTSPWRTLVLTLSPGWYVRNFVGNAVLATAEGLKLSDWQAAWKSYRSKDELGRFSDMPFVTKSGLADEAGGLEHTSLIPRARHLQGVQEAASEVGVVRGTAQQVQRSLLRVNEVVDEFARAAVYHKGLRLNMKPAEAWERASHALVDYNALSPFERSVVRSVVPFYSWQKGILKVTLHQMMDHPGRTSMLMLLGRMNDEYMAERFGMEKQDIPEYYNHLIGNRNVRSYNPFADPSELLSPEGIARSMNPFLELAVRKGMGAPEFVPESYRLGFFGAPQADVDIPTALGEMLTSSPGGRLLGVNPGAPEDQGVGERVSRLFGTAPVDEAELRSRLLRARRQIRGIPNPETGTGNTLLPPRLRQTG